jgi:hypothetical protein
MLAPWAVDEMKTAQLEDKRLNKRLVEILSHLGARPTASIPAACGGYAETAAAYRFFDNDRVTFDNVLQPHLDATEERIAAQPLVLLVQDTTEVDVTRPEQQVVGTGPLDGDSRFGVLLHAMHAFTSDGTPLGTTQVVTWARQDDRPRTASLTRAERACTPIEEKESFRWVVALERAQAAAQRHPQTRMVCVADSEADIYELMVEGTAQPRSIDWIVRGCQDRALQPGDEECTPKHLREQLLAQPVLFTKTIHVRGRKPKVSCEYRERRQPRESRETEVEARACRVTLRPPWRADRKLPEITVNAVLVSEVNPPPRDVPVEWLLLTSLPIDDVEQVRLIIQYYSVRWMIELFFRVLKMGCRVEERRFEHIDRLLPCLAIYMIVAWRTLFLCRLGRAFPEISCEAFFEPAEWKSVYQVTHRRRPPRKPPKLGEMVRLVAQLGGYVNRKRADPPGPQTLWLGLQRLHDITLCWETFGPGATRGP